MKTIKDLPEHSRPREKLQEKGASALTDEELVAAILSMGTAGVDVRTIARQVAGLIREHKTGLTLDHLRAIPGVGLAKACQILSAFELARRHLLKDTIKITVSQDILPLEADIAGKQQEYFVCISLNGANEVIEFDSIMETMKPFQEFPASLKKNIRYVLTDIDDTLTLHGLLPAAALTAMERLRDAGVAVIPITGRPAGWCDHIARMWPVAAVVGENGAFYYRYDRELRKMQRRYFKTAEVRAADRSRLEELRVKILAEVPGCAVSADQAYREADLAIDFCEDVPRLSPRAVERIVQIFEDAGAQAKVSSIHVNGWFGAYDKLTMTRRLFRDAFKEDLEAIKSRVIFAGDSPNDQPMFAFFPNAVGVANVREFAGRMESLPGWVTQHEGGGGFAEMVEVLLS